MPRTLPNPIPAGWWMPPTSRAAPIPRSGMALLVCLFVVFAISVLVVNVLTTEALQLSAERNVYDYERALQLANAGIHHACAKLEEDPDWRGTVSEGSYPADDTYSATAVDADPGDAPLEVEITASGVSGDFTRTVVAKVEF